MNLLIWTHINAGIGSLSIEDINELDIVGVATAANFKTGVSNLHNVGLTLSGGQIDVGSNIKIGTAGVVTATSFVGSGANLTGVTALSGSTNNTVCTVTGANAIQGEANLTFDGTGLLHLNNSTGSSEAVLKLESESGSDARLILDTSNGGGAGAHIDFQIDGTAKGGIQYVTNGSASDQHDIIFRNNTYAERLRIDSSGNVGVNTDFAGSQSWRSGNKLEIFGGGGNVTGELHLGANRGDGAQSVGSINFFDNTQDSTHRHIAIIEADKTGSTSNKRGGDLLFYTKNDNVAAPTEKLRIDSSGNVGVNYTSTQNWGAKFRVGGLLLSDQGSGNPYVFGKLSSAQDFVIARSDTSGNLTEHFRIKAGGSVAIAGDNVNISTDTAHTVNNNEKVAIKNRYVDASATEINLDTSGNLGQSVNLSSHSSSSNHLAMLTFDSGSLKSGIAGGRASSSNWGTELRFYTHPNATNNVHKTYERMRIDNEGSISLRYGRVNDAGHQIYRYGGRIAGTATVSVDIPVLSDGNIYWIEAFYTHHSLAYGGYLYGVYGAYSGHSGLQINNTIGSSTAGGSNVGTWSVSRGNAGQPVVVAKTAGSYGGNGYWWVHVHAGTTPNI